MRVERKKPAEYTKGDADGLETVVSFGVDWEGEKLMYDM